ncbi:MAG TPA: replication initiation protein [Candidatus Cybelea sp.]|nr:replication initiation protein [Candidatus Cybelea sp.]
MLLGSYSGEMKRPFVDADNIARATLFPMPLALIIRRLCEGSRCTASALKLFYLLVFISWNEIANIGVYRPLAYDSATLKGAVGRNRMTNKELSKALRCLTECLFALPDPDEPHETTEAPLLDWHHVEDDRVFWAFSDPVRTWCGRPGSVYAELDLRVAAALSNVAGLRLYEIAAALQKRDRPNHTVRTEALRGLLEVADDEYLSMSDFTGKLLRRAIKSINAHAPFTLDHAPRTPYRHRFADAHVLSVTPRSRDAQQPEITAVPSALKQIRREDLSYVPLPSSDVFANFSRRPAAMPLPSTHYPLSHALSAEEDDSAFSE